MMQKNLHKMIRIMVMRDGMGLEISGYQVWLKTVGSR